MPKSANQKCKLLYLMRILLEQTDQAHSLTVGQMIGELARYGIRAERKSIYDDFAALELYGLDIERRGANGKEYYVASRRFELPELKLLVDAVQSSKFITRRQSERLIKKLETLASNQEARQLQRQVYVSNRVKAENNSAYYNVDAIHASIGDNRQIAFLYFEYTIQKEKRYRRNGEKYVVSPYALIWEDENYYLLAYDAAAATMKHYRVDKMERIETLPDEREGHEAFEKLNLPAYSKQVFGMFGGRREEVKLRFHRSMTGVVLDRFGQDIFLNQTDEEHFTVRLPVQVSPQFFGWLFGLGNKVEIVHPPAVREAFRQTLEQVCGLYGT